MSPVHRPASRPVRLYFRTLMLGTAISLAAAPALAQLAGGPGTGAGMSSPTGGAAAPQPLSRTPDIAPPALPGAGIGAPMQTAPKMQKAQTGDPTAQLFTAINGNDYNSAQDALSRGADLNAQNQFGETPLDLAIALNRTSLMFMLLQTRNELAAQGGPTQPIGQPWLLSTAPAKPATRHHITTPPAPTTPVRNSAEPRIALPANPGTPNPQAGFLGFGPKN